MQGPAAGPCWSSVSGRPPPAYPARHGPVGPGDRRSAAVQPLSLLNWLVSLCFVDQPPWRP